MTAIDQRGAFQTGHVGLNVSDISRSRQFYQDVFGFEVSNESSEPGREFVFLSQGDTLVLTLWQQSSGQFGKSTPGLHHLSFLVPSVADVAQAKERIVASGGSTVYDGIVSHSEGAQSGGVFFTDPDGIRLEIFSQDAGAGSSAPVAGAPTCGFF